MLFNANKQPKIEEDTPKMYGMTPIRKAVAKCEIHGEKSEDCKKAMKEIGITFISENE